MDIRVLGRLEAVRDGLPVYVRSGHKPRLVLAVLLARADRVVTTEGLIAAVWGDRPPASARRNVQQYVLQLRDALGGGLLARQDNGYVATVGDHLDAARFRRLAADGEAALACGEVERACRVLRAALDLWRGAAFHPGLTRSAHRVQKGRNSFPLGQSHGRVSPPLPCATIVANGETAMPKRFSPDVPPSTTTPHRRDAGANLHPLLRLQRAAGNNAISGLMVQRREVQQSAMGRLWQRATGSTPTLPPQDWFYLDRLHWEAYPDPMQSPFVRACLYNTQNHRPQEYETVRQRHDYYRAMSWVLQHGPGMPPGVQAIRFFDATAAVTDSPGVGTVEAPAGALVSAEARRVLVEVNEILLDVNMRVINRVMASSSLVDPRDETSAPTGGMEFDLRMVETEQARVERYLTEHPAEIAQVRNELNDLVNDTRGTMLIEPIHITWAKAALGVTRLLFSEQSHRIAIGKAMVFMLHRRQQAEYTRYIRTGQREYRPTPAR